KESVNIVRGVCNGFKLGSPLALEVENKDWKRSTDVMGIEPLDEGASGEIRRKVTRPRPGHADLLGGIKYGHRDMRNVLERSSAHETTIRVAAGAVAKRLLLL